jgi:Ca2+-binding EF-hand superfamily protein
MNKRSREGKGESSLKRVNSTSSKENLWSVSASFKFHDLKGDGVIDREELISIFKSDKTVAAIIERLDKNRDGVISYAGTVRIFNFGVFICFFSQNFIVKFPK